MSVTHHPAPEVSRDDLDLPSELDGSHVRSRLIIIVAIVVGVIVVVTLLPGLGSLRTRLEQAQPDWLVAGVAFKFASGLAYVVIFREVFCRRMSWRHSYQIGMSELAANAVVPTGGAGGLALGAWALGRSGVSREHIARRTVAFFLLTSLPNIAGVIVIGLALAVGLLHGHASLLLTLGPAAAAAIAIVAVLGVGRWAARLRTRVERRHGPDAKRVVVLAALDEGVSESIMLLREGRPLLLAGLVGYLALDILVLWCAFHAFGASPSMAIIWIAYLLGELGGLIPIPGGIGGVDLGLVGTLTLYGVRLTDATAAVLVYRAIALWVPAVFGGLAFIALRRTLRDEATAIAGCGPDVEMEVIGRGKVRIGEPLRPIEPRPRV